MSDLSIDPPTAQEPEMGICGALIHHTKLIHYHLKGSNKIRTQAIVIGSELS